jgi:mRNA interferase RelE/StbE
MRALELLGTLENPRERGKPLAGNLKNFWRYRTGDYRILAEILDTELLILVVEISNRKYVYRQTRINIGV